MKKLSVLALLGAASFSGAITFDWENLSSGVYASVAQTVSGMTATATGNPGTIEASTLGGFGMAIIGGPFVSGSWHPIRIDFSALVDSVSLETGDGGATDDDGDLILEAYDSLNNLVDSDTFTQGATLPDRILSVAGADIAYITYRTTGAAAPHSMFVNRVTVNPQSVPEPFTMALMGGAAVAGFRRVRRRRA